jgi:hypothetical protein
VFSALEEFYQGSTHFFSYLPHYSNGVLKPEQKLIHSPFFTVMLLSNTSEKVSGVAPWHTAGS